ncbi:MAG: hypothetical protein M1816_003299, partial [Peltula sp. TS41687]
VWSHLHIRCNLLVKGSVKVFAARGHAFWGTPGRTTQEEASKPKNLTTARMGVNLAGSAQDTLEQFDLGFNERNDKGSFSKMTFFRPKLNITGTPDESDHLGCKYSSTPQVQSSAVASGQVHYPWEVVRFGKASSFSKQAK